MTLQFGFLELSGQLRSGSLNVPDLPDLLVLSNLDRGASESRSGRRLSLKYVAEGLEIYRYGGRIFPVAAGQFLAVPPATIGDVEIGRSAGAGARGMCVSLDSNDFDCGLDSPMLFPSQCSRLGRMLAGTHARMLNEPHRRNSAARSLIEEARHGVQPLLEEMVAQLGGIEAARAPTRYELLRKLNQARSFLHSVDHRAVQLPELARTAGISQFHLLRNFRSCFGHSPSAYHRRIRLEAGKQAIDRGIMSCGEAAHRFGFADASSFSHAYRRVFGVAPTEVSAGTEPEGA